MKSTGTVEAGTGLWFYPNQGATNSSGFTGHPGGSRWEFGGFTGLHRNAYFWSSTESSSYAGSWTLLYNLDDVFERYNSKVHGYSVRCMKD